MTRRERLGVWWYLRKMPKLREDFCTYSLRGDNMWGDSILWRKGAPDGHKGRVYGWVPRLPRVGDLLAMRMQSGSWGAWVFDVVEPCGNQGDMFFATVKGPIRYIENAPSDRGSKRRMQGENR